MFNVKFTVIYDGTNFFGWQRQSRHMTVQGEIETILGQIFQQKITIHGSGRTDRGVHAKGQIASCTLPITDLSCLQKALNALLPKDIRVANFCKMDSSFHARLSAKSKIYSYTFFTKPILDPFTRHTSFHYPYHLDLDLIKAGAKIFIGTKDFSSMSNSQRIDSIKTIYAIDLKTTADGFILYFHGSGFLYKMVRNITGALIEVGQGTISLQKLEQIMEKKSSVHGLRQAPAHGLCLEEVFYSQ